MGNHGHNTHRPKRGGLLYPFRGGGLGPHLTLCGLGQKSTSVPSGFFIHPAVWPQQTWSSVPFRGELRPHLTQRQRGQGLPPYQVASWPIQPFGHNRQELIRRWDSEHELLRSVPRKLPEFAEITQNDGHYAVQGHSRSPILVPIESSYTISY